METFLYMLGLIVSLAIIFIIARSILKRTMGCIWLMITPLLIIGIIIIFLWLT